MARPYVNPAQLWNQLLQLNARAYAITGINSMFMLGADGKFRLSPDYVGQIGYREQLNLAQMLFQTVSAATTKSIDASRLMAEAILLEQADGRHIADANKELASLMHKAVVVRYGQSVEKRKQVPSYPRANRLSGALRRSITAKDMVIGSADGIKYVNQDRLNTEARHWARINFGVRGAPGARMGAAKSPAPKQFDVLGAGKVGFKAGPRPPMYLPPGFWEFIGGRASAREERLGKVRQGDERTASDVAADRRAANEARRRARIAARMGEQARAGDSSASGGRFDKIKEGGAGNPGFTYRKLGPTSGTSRWGTSYGGYGRTRIYRRKYTMKLPGLAGEPNKVTRKKTVTSVVRGVRKSRQAFWPMKGGRPTYPTAGVVASHFLDAGFQALSENAVRVYTGMANDIVNASTDKRGKARYKKLRLRYNAAMDIQKILGSGTVPNPELHGDDEN